MNSGSHGTVKLSFGLLVLLAAVFAVSVGILPLASEDSDADVGDSFVVDNMKFEIISQMPAQVKLLPYSYSGDVVIPSTVNYGLYGYMVTQIGDSAFNGNAYVTSIEIPVSITTIGDDAFRYCTGLTSIDLPSSISFIGENVFTGCQALTAINVSEDNVLFSSDGGVLFRNDMTELIKYPAAKEGSSYTIPNEVTKIDTASFSGCLYLESVYIPEGITKILDGTFSDSASLVFVKLPDSVSEIGVNAFSSCINLRSVGLSTGLAKIDDYAFSNCNSLSAFIAISDITTIGNYAFSNCESLADLNLGTAVTSIGDFAFNRCTGVNEISIPDSVKTIGVNAFQYCISASKITIGSGLMTIPESAFRWCSGLTDLTIGPSVITVGQYAFEYCISLKELHIPDSVITVDKYAFSNCSSLSTVYIGTGVTSIKDSAFLDCIKLFDVCNDSKLSLTRGSSGNGRVAYYALLIRTPEDEDPYFEVDLSSEGNGKYLFFRVSATSYNLVNYLGTDSDITLPETIMDGEKQVKSYYIAPRAFFGNEIVRKVTFPGSVSSVNTSSFERCINLKEITFKKNTYSVGERSFYGCTALQKADFGTGVRSFGMHSFENCSSLYFVNIGTTFGVTVNTDAFLNCTSLVEICNNSQTEITKGSPDLGHIAEYALNVRTPDQPSILVESDINGGKTVFAYVDEKGYLIMYDGSDPIVTLPDSFEYGEITVDSYVIYHDAFRNCGYLTGLIIPSSVTSIGDRAFNGCRALRTISFSEGLEEIGVSAFYNCNSLSELIFPASLKRIGDSAFYDCNSLKTLFIGDMVKNIGLNAFFNSDVERLTIPIDVSALDIMTTGSLTNLVLTPGENGIGVIYSEGDVSYFPWSDNRSGKLNVTFSDGIISIGHFMFGSNMILSHVSFSSSIRSISARAFDGISFYDTNDRHLTINELSGRTFTGGNGVLKELELSTSFDTVRGNDPSATVEIADAPAENSDYSVMIAAAVASIIAAAGLAVFLRKR